ncbi:MAG: hypothetical protein OEZ65_07350 [Gemmatimonadota bacterium]|nr:hypothetical protein [Gemmatimonadota bacterium]MDH5759390.1 hypothetical protein [Gemmatimonadota bacterium]
MSDRFVGTLSLAALLVGASAALPGSADRLAAQFIPIRTVPVAVGDPPAPVLSPTRAMGEVTLAVDDSIADAWTNPAKGVLLGESYVSTAPALYGFSGREGGARTFPVTGVFRNETAFGGVSVAIQQLYDEVNRTFWPVVNDLALWAPNPWPSNRLDRLSRRNLFFSGFAGMRVGDGWALGVGMDAAALQGVEGVDRLYANADDVEQSGSSVGILVGAYRGGDGSRLGIVLGHHRISMEHVVSRSWVEWDSTFTQANWISEVETNQDRTRTWAGQVTYDRDLTAPGWRIGASGTVNRKSHPKIPNYELQNIPRDPGTTWAWEGGVGVSRTVERTSFAVDLALQPIWSHTWQEADGPTMAADSTIIPDGDMTIENHFFFTNAIIRTGFSHATTHGVTVRAGVEVRSYAYTLDQDDYVQGTRRKQTEGWMEWMPTLGADVALSDIEIGYSLRITTGTGQPGLAGGGGGVVVMDALAAGSDFVLAPEGRLTLTETTLLSHQFGIRVPIR